MPLLRVLPMITLGACLCMRFAHAQSLEVPSVHVACDAVDASQTTRLFAVEWRASPLSRVSHRLDLALEVTCDDAAQVQLEVHEGAPAAPIMRRRLLNLQHVAPRARARALALALIELAAASPQPEPEEPTALPPQPAAPAPGPPPLTQPALPRSPPPRARWLLFIGGAVVHDEGNFAAAPAASLRAVRDGSSYLSLIADVRVGRTSATLPEGEVIFTGCDLQLAAGARWGGSRWALRGAVGPVVRSGRLTGNPADATRTEGHNFWGASAGAAVDVSASLRLSTRVWLDVSVDAGYWVLPLSARLDDRPAAEARGVRLGGRVGIGLAF